MNRSCDIPIDAYHDGELSPSQRLEVQRHLEQCASCAQRLRDLQAISAALEAAPHERLSQIAAERLRRGIEARMAQARFERDRTRMAWRVGAAAACVALAGTLWLMQASTPAEAAPPWVEIAAATDRDPAIQQATSPVAQWYLASTWQQDSSDGSY